MTKIDWKMQDKFKPHIKNSGGVFTSITRNRLLGISGRTGRGRTKSDFWYDVRTSVKNALIDLELFIETADDGEINKVLNHETLRPVVFALLSTMIDRKPDKSRAEIAQLFIEIGFHYLTGMSGREIPLGSLRQRVTTDAVELSHLLAESFKS